MKDFQIQLPTFNHQNKVGQQMVLFPELLNKQIFTSVMYAMYFFVNTLFYIISASRQTHISICILFNTIS